MANAVTEQLCPSMGLVECKYVQQKPFGPSSGNLKVWVPKLMPQIPMALAKDTPEGNPNPTANAKECEVKGAPKITRRNYYVAMAPSTPYKHSLFDFGASLIAEARYLPDGNLDLKLRSDEADPSHD